MHVYLFNLKILFIKMLLIKIRVFITRELNISYHFNTKKYFNWHLISLLPNTTLFISQYEMH